MAGDATGSTIQWQLRVPSSTAEPPFASLNHHLPRGTRGGLDAVGISLHDVELIVHWCISKLCYSYTLS